ncbi:MAG: signal peptide peptidase SppA [Armatimonadetes bacterium]|nr:signal peptide peptidase SppA [Armatimonadota bacterium]
MDAGYPPPPLPPSAIPPPPPPYQRPPGRPTSFWVAIILAVMLGGSLLLNVVLAIGAAVAAGKQAEVRRFTERLVAGNPDADDKVLSISVSGMLIGGGEESPYAEPDPVTKVREMLRQARKDDKIKAILLEVDSPGGGITASDVIYHELATYRKEKNIPIVVLCEDLTASGGYYISMAADHIVAHETTMVGSIGVIAQFFNVSKMMGKVGLEVNVIKSMRFDKSESFKDIGSPYREMKPAERAFLQSMIDQMWNRFVNVVAEGRKGKLTRAEVAKLADGRIWTGREALRLKLVDSLGYRQDAWRKAADLGKAPQARLVAYSSRDNFLRALLSTQATGARLERALLDPMTSASPRLMYLWTH